VNDTSLSLWLDASNTSSYSGTGTTWVNLGYGGTLNNATLSAAHQTYSSNNGGYFLFDGTANPILINKVTSAVTDVTMSTWVYITPGSTSGAFIKNGGSLGYTFGAGGGGGFCNSNFPGMLLAGQGWLGSNPGSSSFLTGWQLCTMVITGSSPTTYKYYINNTLANTATFTGALAPSGAYTALGDNYSDGGACTPFNSKMGAVYIYTKALTDSEITKNYNASAARFGLNLIGSTFSSNNITTTVNPAPSASVTVNGDACVYKTTLSTTTGLSTYQWYKDNILISGATSNSYAPSVAGEFKVQVSNGTCSNTSTTTTISVCGLTAEGKMIPVLNSTTLVSKEGATNNGKGLDERGLIIYLPIPTITSAGGRIWMDRNLGATRVATSSKDLASYGDLYQWGRGNDGHQLITSNAITIQATSDDPGNSMFIYSSGTDWRNPSNNNLWQGVNGINNPCPTGFRLPTQSEWDIETNSWSNKTASGAFASPLKLPYADLRGFSDASIISDFYARYWSSTVNDGTTASSFIFDTGWGGMSDQYRNNGFSCRCIKD